MNNFRIPKTKQEKLVELARHALFTKCRAALLAPEKIAVLFVLAMITLLYSQANGALRLTSSEAKQHVGESATVCGKVVSATISKYSVAGFGKPITFFLDEPETNPTFSFAILARYPAKAGQIKEAYEGKRVCVTGKIMMVANVPNIDATEPSQIEIQRDEKK